MHRVDLVPGSGLKSCYKKRGKHLDILNFNNVGQRGNFICPDMLEALNKLSRVVEVNGGEFYIIDLFRDWATQAENRVKYETGKKRAFVAQPGKSFHCAGRAVDIDVKNLNFVGEQRDNWLKVFWRLAKPLGFKPVITIPDIDASEAWHFDFPGQDWGSAYDALDYDEVAKCCTLDVGEWNPMENPRKVQKMFVQAQLIRLNYYDVGVVDGIFGPKTNKVLEYLDLQDYDLGLLCEVLSKRDAT